MFERECVREREREKQRKQTERERDRKRKRKREKLFGVLMGNTDQERRGQSDQA